MAPAIVVVDAFSTGEQLAEQVRLDGFELVVVSSQPSHVFSNALKDVKHEVQHDGDLAATVSHLLALPVTIAAVIAGTESGVFLTDMLSEALGLDSTNGTALSAARRNKLLQHEAVRAFGVRACKQILSTEWSEVERFVEAWNPVPFKVIVKPNQSAGSDHVFLCSDMAELKEGFETINGAINNCGEVNHGVLCMEFLQGKEYVVDSVSRHGRHKAVAVWAYDKRRTNGQFNVLYGTEVKRLAPGLKEAMVEYSRTVLDALNICNGPSHMEIIVTATGPCLVEVGARCHGGHGTWAQIATAAWGTNQITATIDAYARPQRFAALPDMAPEPLRFGSDVWLVNHHEGVVRAAPGLKIVERMPSFLCKEVGVKPGDRLVQTVDLWTMAGRVQLLHDSAEQVERDFADIHDMLKVGAMFELASGKDKEHAEQQGPECH